MTRTEHRTLVDKQFGSAAARYVTSPVHASGPDLEQLVGIVAGRSEARALDLGCGGGHASFHVAPHMREVVAYDPSPDMLSAVAAEAARRAIANIATERGTAESLPFADASFDLVLTRFSAHHWRDVEAALREARRVMKTGGQAVLMDAVAPTSPLLDTYLQSVELLRDPSHVRDYTVEEWRRFARNAGFVPGGVTLRRLRLDYASWIARMRTSETNAAAIRSLQTHCPEEVAAYLMIEADGSFTIETMVMLAD